MANLTKLDFIALDVSGTNYLSWVLDAELHLASNKLGETVKENTTASEQDCAKAMILLRHHLHESLKSQYLTVKSPFQLWKSLKDRFDHQKTVLLPRARYEWIQLRLQDFKTIAEYNSEMFRIVSKLRLCGEDVTDEQSALPEANATSSRKGSGRYHGSPQGHSYGRGRGRGRGHGGRGRGVAMIVEIIIIHGLIPIFRRKMGSRQRINMRKLQMEIFAIDVGCLDIGPVPVVRHHI
ncbi:UNVERIFIED_CONTAM: hypothetical protein Sradi_5159400 [Sesamum radiatum]|uniref:Retrotransposon gag domain-containing protein n=1 Tax=Sesamum radiatum TaxID=300843 RepID=A0AAW2M717_SESRA